MAAKSSETVESARAPFRLRTPQRSMEQCLETLRDETGFGFNAGLVGGSAFHFLKGLRRSPTGTRLAGACHAVRLNAPRVASKFAAWYALSTAIECGLSFASPRDDPWSLVAGPAVASGLLSLRRGLGASACFAALTGAFFVVGLAVVTKYDAVFEDKLARNNS